MEWFLELTGFLIKAAVIAAVVLMIIIAAAKSKGQQGGLQLTDLGQRWLSYGAQLKASSRPPKKDRKALKKSLKKAAKADRDGVVWVLSFKGDIQASQLENFREAVSAVIQAADPKTDQVVVRLKSPGGGVSEYGLAASQMVRLREADLHLTCAVEGVAASGGYMMAVVANEIIAAPFAAVGSIGVVAQVPNFHRVLKKADVDVEVMTAGKHKRTLTLFGENTDEGREKFKQDLNQIHNLFKQFVATYRPALDMEQVAEGDVWFGDDALDIGLIDRIGSIDDELMAKAQTHRVLSVRYSRPRTLGQRIQQGASAALQQTLSRFNLHG